MPDADASLSRPVAAAVLAALALLLLPFFLVGKVKSCLALLVQLALGTTLVHVGGSTSRLHGM